MAVNKTLKVFVSLALIAGSIYYMANMSRAYATGGEANNGHTGEFDGPSEVAQRDAMRRGAEQYAGVTQEQSQILEAARQKAMETGNFREVFRETSGTLTREQREKLREFGRAQRTQREQRMKAAMTEQEWGRYQEKRRERRGQWAGGGRGGRGGDRGDRGGRPGGQRPGGPPTTNQLGA